MHAQCRSKTMMTGGCIRQEEEEIFFDSREDVSSMFSSCPGSPQFGDSQPDEKFVNLALNNPLYQIWIHNPESMGERRDNFLRWMGRDLTHRPSPCYVDSDGKLTMDGGSTSDVERIMADSGAVIQSSDSENGSLMSSWCNDGSSTYTSGDGSSEESSEFRIKSLDDGRVFVMDEFHEDGSLRSLREFGKDRRITSDEFDQSFGPSSFVQNLLRRDDSSSSSNCDRLMKRRMGWLRRLGAVACIVDRQGEELNPCSSDSNPSRNPKIQRVKVRSYKKKSKEFSAVFMGQDIKAHDGAILTMKFSPDGQYLASGGEDRVVRVWRVMEHERTGEDDLPEDDPSCIFFTANHNSELIPLYADKEKKAKSGSMRTSDSACVVVPSNVFWIHEKPLHEFHGHQGDVLDLSWSKDKHLLSSSMDKTVRLWHMGCNSCLKVFSHTNYVTCVQFNPVDESYFISGSIDGKVRIWEIPRCRVVDWIDIREIVTAVCYRPDGKGGVVGTIAGDCRFYDASDNHLQLDAKVSLEGKKKSVDKRITGFQFCPSDPRKLMVTSADSRIRILDGVDVVCKYKGLRNTTSRISASFTSDGRHIISASEDSNVYVWNHNSEDGPPSNHVKSTQSCERFFSSNASVAISWNGFESKTSISNSSELLPTQQEVSGDQTKIAGSFTLNQEFFSEFLPKGSATWPEEKLPSCSTTASALCKSQYKLLKSFQNASSAWGQVIVTAGWDGRIRSFRNYGLPLHM